MQHLPVLLLFAAAQLLLPAQSMFDKLRFQLTKENKFDVVWAYYFDARGAFNVHAKVDSALVEHNSTVQLLLCPASSLPIIQSFDNGQECESEEFRAAPTVWQTRIGGDVGQEVEAGRYIGLDDPAPASLTSYFRGPHRGAELVLSIAIELSREALRTELGY
jgi:hypothetical protein